MLHVEVALCPGWQWKSRNAEGLKWLDCKCDQRKLLQSYHFCLKHEELQRKAGLGTPTKLWYFYVINVKK